MKGEKKAPDRINFQVSPEFYAAVSEAAGNQRISAFVRGAVEEKLGRTSGLDSQTKALLTLYDQLNDHGRAWLVECASIAAACDTLRRPRRQNGGEA